MPIWYHILTSQQPRITMIKKLTSLKKAVKGQTIIDLIVAEDDTSVDLKLSNGKKLIITGELMPLLVVSPKLEMELIQK